MITPSTEGIAPEFDAPLYKCELHWKDDNGNYILVYTELHDFNATHVWFYSTLPDIKSEDVGALFKKYIIVNGGCDVLAYRKFRIEILEKTIELEDKWSSQK